MFTLNSSDFQCGQQMPPHPIDSMAAERESVGTTRERGDIVPCPPVCKWIRDKMTAFEKIEFCVRGKMRKEIGRKSESTLRCRDVNGNTAFRSAKRFPC
jgi:hypothetical protein